MSSRSSRLRVLFGLFLTGYAPTVFGFTQTGNNFATNGSQSDVIAAIAAASTGAVITVPAGTFSWGATGAIGINKAVTLKGAGQGNTTINLQTGGPSGTSGVIQLQAAGVVRDMTIVGAPNVPPFSTSSASGWRITNITYTFSPGGQAYFCHVAGSTSGLIDNCHITGGPSGSNELIFVVGPTSSWQTASSLGGADNIFIEDCTFTGAGYVCDANVNSRVVVRFCTIAKVDASTGPAQAATVDATANTFTVTAHGFTAVQPGFISATSLPTGVSSGAAGTLYYAAIIDANTLKLYSNEANATANDGATGLVNPSNTGTGVTFTPADPARFVYGQIKVDAHGIASNPPRGVRHVEVYGNHWTANTGVWPAVEIRGGTGMIFNNVIDSSNVLHGAFHLTEYGYLGITGAFNGVHQTPLNYPIADQIGTGQDVTINATDIPAHRLVRIATVGTTSFTAIGAPNNNVGTAFIATGPGIGSGTVTYSPATEPLYLWLNRRAGNPWTRALKNVNAAAIAAYQTLTGNPSATFIETDLIQRDRDFFADSGFEGSAFTFNGSQGIGTGTKVQMLAITPTKVGVGFWVTDEGEWNTSQAGVDGQLYSWNGTAWVLKYKPYTYPHPLRAPTGPTNLSITSP